MQSEGHSEVYRYDAVTEALDCASCNPTNETAASDATLASDGQASPKTAGSSLTPLTRSSCAPLTQGKCL